MVARSLMSAYLLVGVMNVIANWTSNLPVEQLTKPLLMPLLIAWLVTEVRRAWSTPLLLLLVGLVFSWFGDLLLMGSGDVFFAAGIGAFLVTQVCYAIGFTRVPGLNFRRGILIPPRGPVRGLVSQHRLLLVPFVAYLVAMVWVLWPTAGIFRGPFLVYGCVLLAMSICALNLVHRMPVTAALVTFGGAVLFVASDTLIALTALGPVDDTAPIGAIVMLTYIVGQGLISLGLVTGVRDLEVARRELAELRR